MINRDVIQLVYILLLFLWLIFPHRLHARGNDSGATFDKNQNLDKNYDSYENYMIDRHDQIQKERLYDTKTAARRNPGPLNRTDKKPLAAKKKFTQNNEHLRYIVHRGETVTGIAKKFNVAAPVLCSYNNIIDDNSIKAGAILKIPLAKRQPQAGALSDPKSEYGPLKNRAPQFIWPLTHMKEYKKDEFNGVRPIGIIITGTPGSSVLSSAPGVVKKIGQMRGFGKYVVINHAGRYATVYANLGEITVSEGEKTLTGYMIGKINNSDKRIHFQIDFEGKPENPLKYLPKN